MRILITGGGMIGSHAARELEARGDEVTVLDIAPREDYLREVAGSSVTIVQGDVTNLPALLEAVRDVAPEVILHTVALIGGVAQVSPYRGVTVNVVGTVNVAETARLLGIRRLVHTSTLGVNNLAHPQPAPLTESFPLGGSGRLYGATKSAAELLLDAYANLYGFELVMLRLAGVYGRGHFVGGSTIGLEVYQLVEGLVAGRPVTIGAGIAPTNELVHVKDVAAAIATAVHAPSLPHRVYNVGTGVLLTAEDVAEAARRVFPGAEVATGPARPDAYPRLQPFDLTRSRAELGYEPRFDLDRGLRDLADELRTVASR